MSFNKSSKSYDQPSAPAVIDGWFSLRPTYLQPSIIPDKSVTAAETEFSSTLLPREGHATSDPTVDGKVYIFGGRVRLSGKLNDLWIYSLEDNSAASIQYYGDIPSPRAWSSISVIGEKLVVWGGRCNAINGDIYDNALYSLDLDSHEWTKINVLGEAPVGRESHGFATVGSTFYIFGGSPDVNCTGLNDLWLIDLNTCQPTWRSVQPFSFILPPAREGHSMVLYQNQLITFGGCTKSKEYNDVWSFDLKTLRWTELPPCVGQAPFARWRHKATIIDDMIYVFGGHSNDGVLHDLAVFNIPMRRWFIFDTMGPNPRYNHTLASAGPLIYLLGGLTGERKNDTDIAYILDTETIEDLSPGRMEEMAEKEREGKTKWRNMWQKQKEKSKGRERNPPEGNQKQSSDLTIPLCIRVQEAIGRSGLCSKFLLEGVQDDPETEIEEVWTFSINTDISMSSFHSQGAQDDPPKRLLQGTYQKADQLSGFDRFSGRIGRGKFYLRTDRGVVIRGDIVGGPQSGQSFAGAGTWLRS